MSRPFDSDAFVPMDTGIGRVEMGAWYHRGLDPMLRAALIGFGSSGKTTLFQLMTSAREGGR